MATSIGNITEGKAYPGNVGVTPVSPAGKPVETAKNDPNFGKDTVDISKIFNKQNGKEVPVTKTKEDVKEELERATQELSHVVQSMGANLAFSIHEGTNRLMVRMVDSASGTILKEYPSSEFLDMVSRIRDYVGNLLDKRV